MLVLGIDDAGRGPLIGPMILAGVLMTEEQEKEIKIKGAKDSKLLSHPTRIKLAEMINDISIASHVVATPAEDIDNSINSGVNLNTLEAIKAGQIINNLNHEKEKIKVILDCPSVNTSAWRDTLLKYIKHPENLEVICEHKADYNYPSVSAASILAKVAREEEVEKLKKQYGNIGSGYPSDPNTIAFVKSQGKKLADSGIFRKTWATWKELFPEEGQSKLEF